MRSRQHVVCTRLNDEEWQMYERILRRAIPINEYVGNNAERFRRVLRAVNERVKLENMRTFYENLDV